MHVKNSKPILPLILIDYQYDGTSLYLVAISKTVRLISLAIDSLETLTNATIDSPVHFVSKPCIDDSFVFLPTKVGHILALDKYSGDIVHTMDLGSMMIMSDIHQDDQNLYCMTGLPLSNGVAVASKNYCLNILDKTSGKKLAQGQCFPGIPNLITVKTDIWCMAKHEIHQYSKQGELKSLQSLTIQPSYAPLVSDSFVISASQKGSLEIFNKDTLKRHGNIMIEKNYSPPVIVYDNLLWFVETGVMSVDLKSLKATKLASMARGILSSTSWHENSLYGCNLVGEIVQFNMQSGSINSLKLSDKPLWKPVMTDRYLFVSSKEHIYQIEV